ASYEEGYNGWKNWLHLFVSIEDVRLLARQRCNFRGHDKSVSSLNGENFDAVLDSFKGLNNKIKIIVANAPGNAKYTSSKIQKKIANILGPKVIDNINNDDVISEFELSESRTAKSGIHAMHRVGSAGNASGSNRPRKEKRFTYVLNASDDTKHYAGINCLAVLKANGSDRSDYLFTGCRDGTLKRWALDVESATCSATFESHVDWTWSCLSDGVCTKTLRQHSDYVTCLGAAEKNSNMIASGGLGGEVFVWDIEAALTPVSKSNDGTEEESSIGINGGAGTVPMTSLRNINSSNNLSSHSTPNHGYVPISAKGHKESVYALAMNDSGSILVSGGTEKVVRVWDPRSGSKTMKLRGHTDNVRALLLDSTGRYCISGSSDSMIRLWDLGQQRCVHSYAVHTDSVWALASTTAFTHVYSGGRDQSLYLTDLSTRESILICEEEHPILQLALNDENIWVATTDSSVHRWPAEVHSPQKVFQKGGSFLAGNLSFSRARASLEGSTPVPVHRQPTLTIPGTPAIVQHEILNNRRHVLTKDTSGSVKLWEITRGIIIEDYGEVNFDEKKKELFEMVSIPAWFTVDTRLGSLSIHLDTPQCFSAEMYSMDLNIVEKPEDDKINLARETLKGLLAHWWGKIKQRVGSQKLANGEAQSAKDISTKSMTRSRVEVDGSAENDSMVYPPFQFSVLCPPSIITEGSQGGAWRKKITDLDGTEDEKNFPGWVLDCILINRLPPRENTKCSFYLYPCEGTTAKIVTQGKLSAPRILRIQKVSATDSNYAKAISLHCAYIAHTLHAMMPCGLFLLLPSNDNCFKQTQTESRVIIYVIEKMVLDKPLEGVAGEQTFPMLAGGPLQNSGALGDGSLKTGLRPWQRLKPSIEVLCNDQVLSPDMSLATIRAYVWKKSEDLSATFWRMGWKRSLLERERTLIGCHLRQRLCRTAMMVLKLLGMTSVMASTLVIYAHILIKWNNRAWRKYGNAKLATNQNS
ncbi:hypothetical protein KSS87_022929, partial [Heliosperma pusillum]